MKTILLLILVSTSLYGQKYLLIKGDAEVFYSSVFDSDVQGGVSQGVDWTTGDIMSIGVLKEGAKIYCYTTCQRIDTVPGYFFDEFGKQLEFYSTKYYIDSVKTKVQDYIIFKENY
jgi:hypothetical protein